MVVTIKVLFSFENISFVIITFYKKIAENDLGTFSYYHLMVVNDSKIVPKSSKKFVCVCCDYSTSRKSQYNRHLLTAKHLNHVNDSKRIVKKFQEVPNKKVSFVVVVDI